MRSGLGMPVAEGFHCTVVAEQLTPAAFEPFGSLITGDSSGRRLERNTYATNRVFHGLDVDSDEPAELLLTEVKPRPLEVKLLERHLAISQTFIPLNGQDFLIVVARPEAELANGVPTLEELRAFSVPGDAVVQINRGTWHEPPFVTSGSLRLLITSHAKLTAGLAAAPDEDGEIHVGDVDKRSLWKRAGLRIQIREAE